MSAEASVRRLDLLPEDKAVIIASDGLWDVIGDQDVVSMVDQLIKVRVIAAYPQSAQIYLQLILTPIATASNWYCDCDASVYMLHAT